MPRTNLGQLVPFLPFHIRCVQSKEFSSLEFHLICLQSDIKQVTPDNLVVFTVRYK
jgi:hypothetical protein